MGLEHLGGDARAADAEVLAIAAECLERLGRRRASCSRVGHVGVFGGPRGGGRARAANASRRCATAWSRRTRRASARCCRPKRGVVAAQVAPRSSGSRSSAADARPSTRPRSVFGFCPPALAGARRAARGHGRARGRRASPATSPSTSARCAGSTTTRAWCSASTRRTSASRWAAAAATTRCSRASGARCPPSASCSASTASRCCSSGRAGCAVAPRGRRGRRGADRSARRSLARSRAARRGRAGPLRERRGRDEPHGRALEGQAARRARRRCSGARACRSRTARAAGWSWPTGELRFLFVKDMDVPDLRRVRRRRLRHRRPRRAARDGRRRLRAARPRLRPLPPRGGEPRGPRLRPGQRLDACASRASTRGWRPRTSIGRGSRRRGGEARGLGRDRARARASPTASWTWWRPAARSAENGLEVVETVAESSARLIVNRASYHARRAEVQQLVETLREASAVRRT